MSGALNHSFKVDVMGLTYDATLTAYPVEGGRVRVAIAGLPIPINLRLWPNDVAEIASVLASAWQLAMKG